MSKAEGEELLMDSDQRTYMDILCSQDAALEQIELILYKMHQLAQRAASDECSDVRRRELQNEIETLITDIDEVMELPASFKE